MQTSTERVREWRSRIKNKADLWDKVDEARREAIKRAKPELVSYDNDIQLLQDVLWALKDAYATEPTAFRVPERILHPSQAVLVFDWGFTAPSYDEYVMAGRGARKNGLSPIKRIDHIVAGLGPMPDWKLQQLFMGRPDGAYLRLQEECVLDRSQED